MFGEQSLESCRRVRVVTPDVGEETASLGRLEVEGAIEQRTEPIPQRLVPVAHAYLSKEIAIGPQNPTSVVGKTSP